MAFKGQSLRFGSWPCLVVCHYVSSYFSFLICKMGIIVFHPYQPVFCHYNEMPKAECFKKKIISLHFGV
jgi:hypothetical protein